MIVGQYNLILTSLEPAYHFAGGKVVQSIDPQQWFDLNGKSLLTVHVCQTAAEGHGPQPFSVEFGSSQAANTVGRTRVAPASVVGGLHGGSAEWSASGGGTVTVKPAEPGSRVDVHAVWSPLVFRYVCFDFGALRDVGEGGACHVFVYAR